MVQLYKRKGADVLVNTQTNSTQSTPQIGLLQGGGYIIVWNDSSGVGGDASGSGIKAQRFDVDGNKVGTEFLVNTTVSGVQSSAQVVTLSSGRFLITWNDQSLSADDPSSTAIRAQLYEANGTPVGTEFLVNTATNGAQVTPTVVELSNGRFVITWQDASGVGGDNSSSGIKAQLFDANGAKVGGEILVNTVILGGQVLPSSTALAGGGFAVTWNSSGSNGGVVSVQIFDDNGVKVGGELMANTTTMRSTGGNVIAGLASGFVVVWTQGDFPFQAGLPATDIRAQLFDSSGVKIGGEIAINTTTSGTQSAPDVDALPGGGFIVTWQGPGPAGEGTNIFARILDATGAAIGEEFVLTSSTVGDQTQARVEVLPSGDIVVTWTESSGGAGNDGSGSAVRSQIFTLASAAPTDLALSDATVSETQVANLFVATLSTTSEALNSTFTYTIVSDSSGGAFGISGNQLIVANNSLLDFETRPTVEVRIRTTDLNGHFYEETLVLNIEDEVLETRYSAEEEWVQPAQLQPIQGVSVVTALAGGGYLVTWRSDYHGNAIAGQLHAADGTVVGGLLDLVTSGAFGSGSAIALPSGGFLLTYIGQGNGAEIFGRIFDSAGAPVGDAFKISAGPNPSAISPGPEPATAGLVSGNSIVAWHEQGEDGGKRILGQLFNANGAKLGGIVRLDDGGASDQYVFPNVVALSGGGFLVTWREDNSSFDGYHAQLFSAAGTTLGASFEITPGADESARDVAALAGGGFVVVLVDNGDPDWHASFQLFDANGNLVGGGTAASGPIAAVGGGQELAVAGLPDGGFVLTWSGSLEGTEHEGGEIMAQIFSATGQAAGDPFMVNQTVANDQVEAAVAVLASGALAFTWNSVTPHYQFTFDILESTIVTRVLNHVADLPPSPTPTEGPDILNGTANADTIDGLGGNDVINGLGGDDILTGGAGDDMLNGGTGNDTYYVDAAGDQIVEAVSEGSDTVYASAGYALNAGAEVEILSTTNAAGTAALALIGNEFGQTIIGNAGNNFLDGGGGADTLNGGAGDDVIIVDSDDVVIEAVGGGNDLVAAISSYALNAGAAVEILSTTNGGGNAAIALIGNEFGQTITGNAGANFLYGNGGADTINGGAGDDVIIVDADDIVIEAVGGGNDLVASVSNYVLAAGAEVEILSTTNSGSNATIALIGNAFGQTITGNAGANFMMGGGGADTLDGGAGDDVIIVDADDIVIEAIGGGNDLVAATGASYTLNAGAEVELLSTADSSKKTLITLIGNEFGQTIIGSDGANILDGGGGDDILKGGAGDDTYIVDAGDQVIEDAGAPGGNDHVQARTSYVLNAGAAVETLQTTDVNGTAAIALIGNTNGQTLVGNAGDNFLDGGGGPDFLIGGAGNDTFIVDDAGERVEENIGGGNDLVAATVSYAIRAGEEVETLSTTYSGGFAAINLIGNEFSQTLIGNAGDNFLDGGAGADILQGLGGNDTYIVENAGDQVIEGIGGGNDLVAANASYVLNAGAEVETLSTVWNGGGSAYNLTGNEFGQTIIGNAANNILDGRLGADTLQGLGGADTFAFTTALGGGNIDTILDFVSGTDRIALDDAIFGAGIGTPGSFNANAFFAGSAAHDADDRIIYDSATGQLLYDADGTGGTAAVQFATLSPGLTLTASDFQVI